MSLIPQLLCVAFHFLWGSWGLYLCRKANGTGGGDNKLFVTGFICKHYYNKLDLTPNQHFNSNKMYHMAGSRDIWGQNHKGYDLKKLCGYNKDCNARTDILLSS